MLKKHRMIILTLVVSVLFSGCLIKASVPSKLEISAESTKVVQGRSVNLSVVGYDKKNNEVALKEVEWSLKDEGKGTLEADGDQAVFTAGAIALGKVTIEVTSGKLSDSIELEIIEVPAGSKEELQGAIDAAKALKAAYAEGDEPGQIPADAHAAFQQAIDAAEAVYGDAEATGEEISQAIAALDEAMEVFESSIKEGAVELDRTGWVAGASNNGSHAYQIFDGVVDEDSRWHGSKQEKGKWLEIDMRSNQTFNLITILGRYSDMPRAFEIVVAPDGESPEYGEPVYTGGYDIRDGFGTEDIEFEEAVTARWIRIVLTEDCPEGKYFAVNELWVYMRY